MTDLIKQLQYLSRVTKDYDQEHMTSTDYEMIPAVTKLAADRIKELERERDDLEAKLAKAVEIGNKMAKSIMVKHYISSVVAEWNAVLAELEDWE
jgi:hypothetical protein